VKASFDSQELIASLAELEKCAREDTPSTRLAEVPSAQLGIDLAAILASVKSRSAPQAAAVEDAARLTDNRPPNQSVPSRLYRRVSAAPAILIVIGSLVGGASYYVGGIAFMALQAPPALQKFDPPLETTASPCGRTDRGWRVDRCGGRSRHAAFDREDTGCRRVPCAPRRLRRSPRLPSPSSLSR
jgi:hypothetical protein